MDAALFHPPPALPRILAHIVNAATPDPSREIEPPCPIDEPVPRAPIVRDGMLRLEGLFDVFDPLVPVACPCVFKASGWSKRSLSVKELLRVFDTPLAMDDVLIPDRRARNIIQRGITPIVVSAIFHALWSNGMGFVTVGDMAQQELTVHEENDTDETGREAEVVRVEGGEDEKEEEVNREENGWRSGWRSRPPMARVGISTSSVDTRWEAETVQLKANDSTAMNLSESLALSLLEPVHEHINQSPLERELFAKLKQEHDLTKAVKSDDAEVPVDLWDQAVCISPPSEVEKKALTVMRDFMLAQYRRRLWLDARKYLQVTHGKDWSLSRHTKVLEDVTTIQDILWRAASNTWFEYPLGSRLIFFQFPARYRTEAKRGVKVFFTNKGPSSRRRQPPLKPDEKAILRKKLLKFIDKGYLAPHVG